MKKTFTLLLFLFCYCLQVSATHIVGGEFEMRYLNGNTYRVTLNLYFDLVNGDPGARDPTITVGFFEKGTNRRIMNRVFNLRQERAVNYTDLECAIPGVLETSKLIYYEDIVFSPTTYNHPAGYYMVWERCCRNNTINNIVDPGGAGQAFYLEFPAVMRNGSPFRNSSPVLFPPLSDYACLNELFYYDFSGSDPDGDSLVYDLVTPLNGSSNRSVPAPTPASAPYSEITWRSSPAPGMPPYSQRNQVQGSPTMTIHPTTGRLTVRPTLKGLFVFGIRCREFRNGVQIGEVRRDFQLLVRDDCNLNTTPEVKALVKGKGGFYNPGEVISVGPAGERCFDIKYTDADPATRISLKVLPVNFSSKDYTFGGVTTGTINVGGRKDTLTATLCFADCFDSQGKIFEIDLIATDDGCSQPKLDTLRLRFIMEPVPDQPPVLSLSTPDSVFSVLNGDVLNFNVLGNDSDGDVISITARGIGFNLNSQNITFQNRTGIGPLTSAFTWPIDCQVVQQESYKIEFTVTTELCGVVKTKTKVVEVRTSFPNSPPVLTTDKTAFVFDLELDEPFEANFAGTDIDLHQLLLAARGQGFDLQEVGMTFSATGGAGNAAGAFKWVANCAAAQQGIMKVDFILRESSCRPSPDQKITMEFRVRVPDITTFIPANIFTPNGDGLNDYFEMPTLPETNCQGNFERIRIFNRWGKEVYNSTDPRFRWDGKNVIAGVYYYVVDYTTSFYKGTVTIVY